MQQQRQQARKKLINWRSFVCSFVASAPKRPMYIRPGPKWTCKQVKSESIKSNTHTPERPQVTPTAVAIYYISTEVPNKNST